MEKQQSCVLFLVTLISLGYFFVNEGLSQQIEAEDPLDESPVKSIIVDNSNVNGTISIGLTCANVLCIVNTTCSMGCPVPKNCRASCKRPNPICPRLPCVKRTPRCLCAKGYVLGPDGRCILKKDCETCKTKKCAANETCTDGCAPTCRPSCTNPNPICPFICIQNGSNCACANGYVIGPKGNCILKEDCPPPTCKGVQCGQNRTCSVCAPTCFPSCEEPNVPCTKICRQDASAHYCPCAPNYLIGPNGNCIRKDDCPPPAIQSTEAPKQCSSKECDAQTHVGCICFPKDSTQSTSPFPFPESKNCSDLLTPEFASCGMFGTVCRCVDGQSDCLCYVIDPPLGK